MSALRGERSREGAKSEGVLIDDVAVEELARLVETMSSEVISTSQNCEMPRPSKRTAKNKPAR